MFCVIKNELYCYKKSFLNLLNPSLACFNCNLSKTVLSHRGTSTSTMDAETNESKTVPKRSLEFLELVGQLKHLKRQGWVLRNVNDPESIASHMYRMAVMSFLIEPSSKLNRLRCMELAIIHDLAECIVGDITPECGISPDEKHRREDTAMKFITELMPTNSEYMLQLFQEYESQESAEAKLVKEFDRLDMVVQAFEYEKQEGPTSSGRLEEFFTSTAGKFSTPFVKAILEEVKLQRNTTM